MAGSRVGVAAPLGYRHQRVQRLRRLMARRATRQSEGAFVLEGAKLLAEALTSGVDVESVFVAPGTDDTAVAEAAARGIRVYEFEPGVLERVAGTVTPQPVMAVAPLLDRPLSALDTTKFVVVLADVRDPGNAGTVLRSAEAAGAGAVVFCEGSVDVYNPKTVRSSAGSLFHVPVVLADTPSTTVAQLRDQGFLAVGTTMKGGTVYDRCDLTRPVALIFGNEANGLDADSMAALDELVSIPIEGNSESLNVSMAASVLCFETARQRRNR